MTSFWLPGMEPPAPLTLEEKVDEAVEFLRKHEPPEGYLVGMSFGKDSIVTLDLVRLSGVKHEAWHSCTRIDPPEVYRFGREHYPDVKWVYPKASLWDMIQKKAPPLRMRRWCCDELKKFPTKKIPLVHRVMGVRAEESTRRASRERYEPMKSYGWMMYKPIFAWTEGDVWGYIESRRLPYPSIYDEGFSRVGCVWCPFLMANNQARLILHMQRWPGVYKAFESATRRWWETKGKSRGTLREGAVPYADAEEFLANYYRGFDKPTRNYPEGSQKVRCLADALALPRINLEVL